jgi:hypothetical protein
MLTAPAGGLAQVVVGVALEDPAVVVGRVVAVADGASQVDKEVILPTGS